MVDRCPFVFSHTGNPDATVRLFCFHHAGGSAAVFKQWIEKGLFPCHAFEVCAVDYPGRGKMANRPCHTDMYEMCRDMADGMDDLMDEKPYIFFGHSLGANVAFELARERRRRGKSLPIHLVVSARGAPQVDLEGPRVSDIKDDDEFIEAMVHIYKSKDLQTIAQVPQFRANALKLMRGDMTIYDNYCPIRDKEPPLDVSITAYCGSTDIANPPAVIKPWKDVCTGPFIFQVFPGGHFFWSDDPVPLIEHISLEIELKINMGLI